MLPTLRQDANKAARLLAVGLIALVVLSLPFAMLYAASYPLANILDYENFVVPERKVDYRACRQHLVQFLLEPNPVNVSRLCQLLANGSPLESRLTKGLWGHYQGPLAKGEFQSRFMTRQLRPDCLPFRC